MPWATPQQFIDRWIGPGAPEVSDPKIAVKIGDAEQTILSELPGIQASIDSEALPAARVTMVVCSMVERAFRNPTKLRTVAETTGPFNTSSTFEGDTPGALTLNDDERRLLGYGPKAQSRKAFTIDPTPAAASGTFVGDLGSLVPVSLSSLSSGAVLDWS
ncbi:hypothetical protein SAMN04515671_2921 [Nakamurella panacisegetis]|uniref:Phage protein Gp19/Gp15/Gp42 n=1 Tax=Nakamurella panacisegetis TaxID=1090615 RepID=A0A1H0PXY0_9ACTN|nr:hypothetical protein [Nakamurella panacisegetis]SDP09348.1 hypothetical protein SAMN04515671_2921 [Nakamurella panacisegetis]